MVAALLWFYDYITNLPAMREHEAFAHGLGVLHLERSLHLDPELTLNHWIYGHPLIGLAAGDVYDNAHFIVTFGIVGWLWWRHPDLYRPLRTGLVLVNVIGFVVFWFWPMAPPRLLPGAHFYDIVAITHAIGGWQSGLLAKVANQFAAMPSLHLGWATWSAFAAWWTLRRHRVAWLIWLYPPLIALDVMATANHLLTDCLAGIATAAVSLLIAFHAPKIPWSRLRARRAGRREADLAVTGSSAPAR